MCGLCTVICSTHSRCSGSAPGGARCVDLAGSACSQSPGAVCRAACENDDDCGRDLLCVDGICLGLNNSDKGGPDESQPDPSGLGFEPTVGQGATAASADGRPTAASELTEDTDNYCDAVDEWGRTPYDPLVARPGETCYEFLIHNKDGVADVTPFEVLVGESYHELHYEIPWGPGEVMSRFGGDIDNLPVWRHYFIFSTDARAPGTVTKHIAGTTLLAADARLIAAWAAGGCGQDYPEEVGMWLPEPGDGHHIMIQSHQYNATGEVQLDSSTIQVCTVPARERPNLGELAILGTEFDGMNIPPGESSFATSCTNDSLSSAYVFSWLPHMRGRGAHMKTEITHLNGSTEAIFNRSFRSDFQVGYPQVPVAEVRPGETLSTTCSFVNGSGAAIRFGLAAAEEVCYQLTSYYPLGALANGVPSLLGPVNTCWGPVRKTQ